MHSPKNWKKLLAACGCLFMLAGCGASSTPDSDPGVQDIQPGEKSIIQPPSTAPANNASTLEEKNI